MSQRVMTEFGPGVVVATETVRGRTQHRVEGEHFNIWVSAAQYSPFGQLEWDQGLPQLQDNSTTLPYNPQPQFYPHGGESTIQPNQHLDTQKRLSPADSVSFEPRSLPGSGSRDFASSRRTAGDSEIGFDDNDVIQFVSQTIDQYGDGDSGDTQSDWEELKAGMDYDELNGLVKDAYQNGVLSQINSSRMLWDLEADAGMGSSFYSHVTATDESGAADTQVDQSYSPTSTDEDYPGGINVPDDHEVPENFALGSVADTQARLGEKYIDIPVDVDRSTLQARLDDDPVRVVSDIKMRNFEVRANLDPRIGQALDLEAADSVIRTAAWADVRAKATRLRRSGAVQLEAANPTAIVATVTGDHGVYTVAVLRGSALTGNSSVSEWSCSCPWGDWAFEREHTYVGRLCSHAYAALQELRSLTMRKEKPRDWSHKAQRKTAGDWDDDWSEPGEGYSDTFGDPYTALLDFQGWAYAVGKPADEATLAEWAAPNGAATANPSEADLAYIRKDIAGEGDSTWQYNGARHQDPDADLATKPGTLTPDLMFVPKTHERRRVDLGADTGNWRTYAREAGWDLGEVEALVKHAIQPGGLSWEEVDELLQQCKANGTDLGDVYDRVAFLSEPFEGSGSNQPDGYESSESYVDSHELQYRDDIDGPGLNPAAQNADDVVLSNSHEAALGYLLENNDSSGSSDIADAAAAFLQRTAGRSFTLSEQQELMDEDAVGGPIEASDLDLRGTHYLS